MRPSRPSLAVLLVSALAVTTAAAARTPFKGNVCSLATAKQVTAIPGVSSRCTRRKSPPPPGAKASYVGNWAGKTPTSPNLQVTIDLYTDSGMLKLATSNLDQGLTGPRPRKVAGIGTSAYEATGAGSTEIQFAVGKYIARLDARAIGKRPRLALEALAKAIAARLS